MTTSANNPGPHRPDAREIQSWLVKHLAERLAIEPGELDPQEQFSALGLDSRMAMALVSKLERWLGLRVSPTLIWNYPTIEALSRRLADDAAGKEA